MAEEKTIGQILYEAMYPYNPDAECNPYPWDHEAVTHEQKASLKVAATAIWNEAVEACHSYLTEKRKRLQQIDASEGGAAWIIADIELEISSLKREALRPLEEAQRADTASPHGRVSPDTNNQESSND